MLEGGDLSLPKVLQSQVKHSTKNSNFIDALFAKHLGYTLAVYKIKDMRVKY